ncbi:hypothetical protein ACYRFS_07230 [Listeria kieliensis]
MYQVMGLETQKIYYEAPTKAAVSRWVNRHLIQTDERKKGFQSGRQTAFPEVFQIVYQGRSKE